MWGEHVELLQRRLDDGSLILAGPTLGPINTGIYVFEAPDEETARGYMNEDPRSPRASPAASCGRSARDVSYAGGLASS